MAKSPDSLSILLPHGSPKQSTSAASTPDAEMLTPDSDHAEDMDAGTAPIEMLSEFLSAVMSRDYEAALKYCKTILLYEPSNKIVQEFYPLIQERILQAHEPQKEEMDSDENTGGEEDDNSSFSSKSASSSEFTSGGSDFDNEDENGNSTTSTSDEYSSTEGGWKTALNTDSDSTEKDNEPDSNSNTESPTLHIDVCANHLQSLSL